jgi:predicted enzyme related to lactoylglutathione lyase
VWAVPGSPLSLIEFPADNPERARRFWVEFLGVELEARRDGEGEGWQTHSGAPAVGVHARGRGPGDSFSLPYFAVSDVAEALERVEALGGSVVHPGEAWAICRDSEGSPFGLAGESFEGLAHKARERTPLGLVVLGRRVVLARDGGRGPRCPPAAVATLSWSAARDAGWREGDFAVEPLTPARARTMPAASMRVEGSTR